MLDGSLQMWEAQGYQAPRNSILEDPASFNPLRILHGHGWLQALGSRRRTYQRHALNERPPPGNAPVRSLHDILCRSFLVRAKPRLQHARGAGHVRDYVFLTHVSGIHAFLRPDVYTGPRSTQGEPVE